MTKELDGVGVVSIHDEDQGGCSTKEKFLGTDLRVYFVFPRHIPADVDLEGECTDLARSSFLGCASELTILTCCISEQQCCMEIDSVSRFTD